MVSLKALGKIVKKSVLTILSIEDESTDNAQVLRVELAEPVEATGSVPLSDGSFPKVNTKVIYIAQGNDITGGNIDQFIAALPKNDEGEVDFDGENGVKYEGTMKLDVSKPRVRNGQVVKEARVWLTAIRFSNGAATLIGETRKSNQDTILKLFGRQPLTNGAASTPKQEEVSATATADDLK